jgi:NosR/NirI family nitrous oxide reductase transcriptional regulator
VLRARRGIERWPIIGRYVHWLHGRWPAGAVEKLPEVRSDTSTRIPGLHIVGDLTGVPLLKSAADSGVIALRAVADALPAERGGELEDVAILGGGVAGIAAAIEAKRLGLRFTVIEATEPFSTIVNFPRGKPIFTYPREFTPRGELQFGPGSDTKEGLLAELREQAERAGIAVRRGRAEQVRRAGDAFEIDLREEGAATVLRARRVIIAIGRSGEHRTLGVPGEERERVFNRLHDPAEFEDREVLVVGGGDSACEAAISLVAAGARVTHCHRGGELVRPRPENTAEVLRLAEAGELRLRLGTTVERIEEASVRLSRTSAGGSTEEIANDAVFTLIGRAAPLDFLRRSGVPIRGEITRRGRLGIGLFLLAMLLLYDWKGEGPISTSVDAIVESTFPADAPARLAAISEWWAAKVGDRSTWIGTLAVSMKSRSFYYTLLYSLTIVIFGIRRIRRRQTPYVARQTAVLMAIQVLPLFLLPELLLPWLGYNGAFDAGVGRTIADALFEPYIPAADLAAGSWPEWGHPRAYWRAYGFILAWPLMVYNVFTDAPMTGWLVIAALQTLVIIPLLVRRWGKGAYCGWICSCGALAETLGDTQREKMPHGPGWNRLNLIGQVFLLVAVTLLVLRIWGWLVPEGRIAGLFPLLVEGKDASGATVHYLSYKWVVDVLFGGILGVGLYFLMSGRVWCRFACPLAALMHIYARFSRFGIVPEKRKCISCNVCTAVCHQGIDVMAFASRGEVMQDPQCVRCSACVQSCPTGVLTFGRVDDGGRVVALDALRARAGAPGAPSPREGAGASP